MCAIYPSKRFAIAKEEKIMSIRGALLCIALGTSAMALPGPSHAGVNVDIDIAPPALREEVLLAPRPGYIWAPGY